MRSADPLGPSPHVARPLARRWRSRTGPGAPFGPALLLGGLTVVALVFPSVASSPTGVVSYTAPYLSATTSSSTHRIQAGCFNLSYSDSRWNNSSGVGGFAGRITAHSCTVGTGGAVNTSSVTITAATTALIPVSRPTGATGPMGVTVNLTLNGSSFNHTHILWNCPSATRGNTSSYAYVLSTCTANTAERFSISVAIEDLTTRTLVNTARYSLGYYETGMAYADDYCYSYGCYWSNYSYVFSVGSLTTTASYGFSFTAVPSHQYGVVLLAQSLLQASLSGFPGSSVIGALNVGTQGHSWSLNRIGVS